MCQPTRQTLLPPHPTGRHKPQQLVLGHMSPRKHRVLRACALHLCSRQPASGLLRPPPKPRCPVRGGDRWPRRGPPAAPSPGGSSQDLPGSQRRVPSGLERERRTAFAFRGRGLGGTRSCAQASRARRVARGSPGVNACGYQSTTETPSLEGTTCTSRTLVQGRPPTPGLSHSLWVPLAGLWPFTLVADGA